MGEESKEKPKPKEREMPDWEKPVKFTILEKMEKPAKKLEKD